MSLKVRIRWLINPAFQATFFLYTAVCSAIVLAVTFAANWYFFGRFEAKGLAIGLPADHTYFYFLRDQRESMVRFFGIGSLAIFGVLVVIGIIFSHRVAGPLHQLQKHMDGIADGKPLANVQFRKKDFFPELASSFNKMAERLGKK